MGLAKGYRWPWLLGLEEGNNRKDTAMIFLGFGQVQLRKDASDVLLDRSLGDPQALGDSRIGAPLGHQREDVPLALIAEGCSNAGIARRLWGTEGTVEKHVRSILAKLNLPEAEEDHRRVLAVVTFLQAQ